MRMLNSEEPHTLYRVRNITLWITSIEVRRLLCVPRVDGFFMDLKSITTGDILAPLRITQEVRLET